MFYDSSTVKSPDISLFYKDISGVKLPVTVYLPEGFDKAKKYPTVILIHGGGWYAIREGSAEWKGGVMKHNACYYQKQGMVSITISYRGINFTPETEVKDLINDCNDALGFIKDNFSFVDTENVVFMGDSAGGHLALSLCMQLAMNSPAKIKPRAVVACNPVTDCTCEKWSYCAKTPEARKEASPMENAWKVDTKFLLLHGTDDGCVAIDDSRLFFRKMKDAGNDIEMIEIPDTKHAFIIYKYRDSDEKVSKAHELIDEFLSE